MSFLEHAKDFAKKMEEVEKSKKQLAVENLMADMSEIKKDSTNIKQNEDWMKAVKKDPYISEASNVLIDWVRASKTGTSSIINSNKN